MKKSEQIQKATGDVIRELRKEKGLTQEKLAELSDLHVNYISYLERGLRQPTLTTLTDISEGLGIRLTDIVGKIEASIDK
ncbi:helix-turn-helix domain-containing protein [Gracilimonas sp. BCB1]|uniref:helix-turn-helix domain-containing protein n=1 Tax=Gracilimonas sp. BCB1 TaxID=3152362 RepID=UPI0032D8B7C5